MPGVAEGGSERRVAHHTTVVCDRSVPSRTTSTCTVVAFSAKWYSGCPKCTVDSERIRFAIYIYINIPRTYF